MKPVLFPANATTFTKQGLGALSDAIECIVTEERNGEYELYMSYPQDGAHYDGLINSNIIAAVPSEGTERQGFRIYKVTRPISGIVSVYAQHVSYQASYIPVAPFTASGIDKAIAGLKTNALEACPFTITTDITSNATYTQQTPESLRARLGGQQGSLLDVYGGEYEFDNFNIKLWKARGAASGATLRYGKNIVDVNQEENIENTYTGIVPYWKNEEEYISLSPVRADTAANFPFNRTIAVDFSSNFEEMPTEAQLLAAAKAYIKRNNIGVPKVSISVSFVALWQTEEYKNLAPLESVKLCDTVQVYFEKLGISTTAKVHKTTWDVLRERYESIEIGDVRHTLSSTVANTAGEIKTTIKKAAADTQKAVNNATKLITGQKGGYVILHLDAETKQPYEFLIMDTDDIDTATNVWRWNAAGWGFSSNGYNGPYNLAATMDGAIIADFIKAGTMEADRIKGGTLTLGGEVNGNGVLEVKDDAERLRGSWSNAGIRSLWIDPTQGIPTDFISINGDEGGVILVQDVTQNSTVYEPIAKDRGFTLTISAAEIDFADKWNNLGAFSCDTVGLEWEGNESYYCAEYADVDGNLTVAGDLTVQGQKDRAVSTPFGLVGMSAYETPTPYFGDIGSGTCDDGGECYIDLDPRLADVCNIEDYQVFLSPYRGEIVSVDKYPGYFVVSGEPGATFAWEVKAKQKGYENNRFELKEPKRHGRREREADPGELAADYIIEQMAEATKTTESEGVEE